MIPHAKRISLFDSEKDAAKYGSASCCDIRVPSGMRAPSFDNVRQGADQRLRGLLNLELAQKASARAAAKFRFFGVGGLQPAPEQATGASQIVFAYNPRSALLDFAPDVDLVRDQRGRAASQRLSHGDDEILLVRR